MQLCIILGINCGNPGTPQGGIRFGGDFTVGKTVKFRCMKGYTLIGSSERTCGSNFLWSGELAICSSNYESKRAGTFGSAFFPISNWSLGPGPRFCLTICMGAENFSRQRHALNVNTRLFDVKWFVVSHWKVLHCVLPSVNGV